jgi:glutaconate CoA-transferase subunit A
MQNKIVSLREAVQLVRPDDVVAFGGITIYRRPVAFAAAMIAERERLAGLTLMCFTAGYESDLLIGAGVASQLRTCYCGLEIFGLAPMFTAKASNGTLRIIEETEASLAFGIRAHLAGVSFAAGQGWQGTDLPRLRPDVKIIDDPYNPGECVTAFPAIKWDVAVIHALKADPSGNALLNGNIGVDIELSLGAREVIITTEEVVEHFSQGVDISGLPVTAVVHTPRGAWPTSCYPLYPVGGGELLRYIDACNAGQFEQYCKELLTHQLDNPL